MERSPSPESLDSLIATYSERGEGLKLLWALSSIQHDLDVSETENALQSTPSGHHKRNECLEAYCTALERRFEFKDSIEDLERAIEARMEIASCVRDGNTLSSLSKLGRDLALRFQHTKVIDDLDRALAMVTDAFQSSEPDSPSKALFLCNMGMTLMIRYKSTKELHNLDRGIDCYEQASHLKPNDPLLSVQILTGLSDALSLRYIQNDSLQDLNSLITALETATESADIDLHPQLRALIKLSVLLNIRWRKTHVIEDLERLISITQSVANTLSEDSPELLTCLDLRGCALLELFARTGSLENLTEAISCFGQWIINSQDRPIRGVAHRLASALMKRSEHTGSQQDLDSAISLLQSVLDVPSDTLSDSASTQINLAGALSQRFQRSGSLDDLESASKLAWAALDGTPENHVNRANCLSNVANTMHLQFERDGSLALLDKEIALRKELLSIKSLESPEIALYHVDLGQALRSRARLTGKLEDLNESYRITHKSLALLPDVPENRELRRHCLDELATVLRLRGSSTGFLSDCNQAIDLYEEAIRLTPEGHIDRPMYLNNLAGVLHERFRLTESLEDLSRSITLAEESLRLHPNDVIMTTLGNTYRQRAELTRSIDDLNRAIRLHENSVELIADNHINRPRTLNALGSVLKLRYLWLKSSSDLNNAIDLFREAIETVQMDDPRENIYMSNLGHALQLKFRESSSLEDLDLGIALLAAAVRATPEGAGGYSDSLADAFGLRYAATGNPEDNAKYLEMHEKSAYDTSESPTSRVKKAFVTAFLLKSHDTKRAVQLLRMAVDLLPSTSPRSLNRVDQQAAVTTIHGLGNRAAALFLEANESPYEALRALELGRGIMASHLLDTRTDITLLEEHYPHIAIRFRNLREEVDSLELSRNTVIASVKDEQNLIARANRRHVVRDEFNELLIEIRALDGFEKFLHGPTAMELTSLASEGPIVVLNVESRCDAFLITVNGITLLPLPKLNEEDIEKKSASLLELRQRMSRLASYSAARKEMLKILEWIWHVAIGPILDELGYKDEPKSGAWPHVWWVPTGALTLIPLHAAGIHTIGSRENCLDRVISSYAPTLKSLAYGRERLMSYKARGQRVDELALVCMAETPMQPDLEYADVEVALVESVIPDQIIRHHFQNPIKSDVLRFLSDCSMVHFACHGCSDYTDPSQSYLLLQDWQHSPLSVADIAALKLDHAQFVYISACYAADNRSETLLDESIHITGACQLAGFASVVGTLWQISDKYSADIAASVYRAMADDGITLDVVRAAEGLHHAVRELREETRKVVGFSKRSVDTDPLIWAVYIHVGV
jgi:tetratricopeptide (TPR) repeat protein